MSLAARQYDQFHETGQAIGRGLVEHSRRATRELVVNHDLGAVALPPPVSLKEARRRQADTRQMAQEEALHFKDLSYGSTVDQFGKTIPHAIRTERAAEIMVYNQLIGITSPVVLQPLDVPEL